MQAGWYEAQVNGQRWTIMRESDGTWCLDHGDDADRYLNSYETAKAYADGYAAQLKEGA